MASVLIKDGIIRIDTHTMDDEEKNGILQVLIDLQTCAATMSIKARTEDVDAGKRH